MAKITRKVTNKNKEMITQKALEEIYSMNTQLAELKKSLQDKENELLTLLDSNYDVQSGEYGVTIKESSRVSPQWKEAYKEICDRQGINFLLEERAIKDRTTPSTSRKACVVMLR